MQHSKVNKFYPVTDSTFVCYFNNMAMMLFKKSLTFVDIRQEMTIFGNLIHLCIDNCGIRSVIVFDQSLGVLNTAGNTYVFCDKLGHILRAYARISSINKILNG